MAQLSIWMKLSQLSIHKTFHKWPLKVKLREGAHPEEADAEPAEAAEITTTEADAVVRVVAAEEVGSKPRVGALDIARTHQIPVVTVISDMGRILGTVPPLSHARGSISAQPDPHEGQADLDKTKTKILITTLCFPD